MILLQSAVSSAAISAARSLLTLSFVRCLGTVQRWNTTLLKHQKQPGDVAFATAMDARLRRVQAASSDLNSKANGAKAGGNKFKFCSGPGSKAKSLAAAAAADDGAAESHMADGADSTQPKFRPCTVTFTGEEHSG